MGKLIRKIKDKFESDDSHDNSMSQGTHETNQIASGQTKATGENLSPPQLTDEVTHASGSSSGNHSKLSEPPGIPEKVSQIDTEACGVKPNQITTGSGAPTQDQTVPFDATTDHTAPVTRKDATNGPHGTAPAVTTAGRARDLKTTPLVEMRVDPEDESNLQFNTETGRHPLEQQAFEAASGSGNQDYDGDANSQSSSGGIFTQIKSKLQGKNKKDSNTFQESPNSLSADEIVTSSRNIEESR